MAYPTTQGDWLELAFQLAYFIHQQRGTARQITLAALESLETTTLTQDKRYYYVGQRTKVSFTELHLLQLLVYEKSAPFEQQRETDPARPLSSARLLVHFIKHLVWITVRHRSLYVAVGLGRLLHGYTTPETMELYNLVIQDPARVPTEDYFRNRKKELMKQMLERFGDLLATRKGPRGAVRFVTHAEPARFAALVRDCLTAFTPWQTGCYVPKDFDPVNTELPDFSFSGVDPDQEHPVEIERYHALLHPECFARLLRALGYAPSVERLEIPCFAQAVSDDLEDEPDDPVSGAHLTTGERDEMQGYLRDREQRRKTASARLLHFVANGAEVARLDLEQTAQVRFQLPRYAEFLEIRGADDLLLATHRLRYDDDDQLRPQDAVIVLQNGQQFAISVAPPRAGAVRAIEISYRETNWLRGLQNRWSRWWATSAMLKPAFSTFVPLVAVLLAVSTMLGLLWQRERQAAQIARQTLSESEARQQQAETRLGQLTQENRATQTQLQVAEQARRDAEERARQLQNQQGAKPKPATVATLTNLYVEQRRLANLKGGSESQTIVVPDAAQIIVLLLEISSPLAYPTYTVEVRDAGGKLLSTLTGLNPRLTRDNRLSVTLARSALQSGVYQLRLFGQRGTEKTDLGEYSLRLQFN